MSAIVGIKPLLLLLLCAVISPVAQSPVVSVSLNGDDIFTVKTALGITTRLVFRGEVKEIICGDLYDSASGTGGFVVQKIGNDVYLKPVIPKGTSNLFVKTWEGQEVTYSFDLTIVSPDQSHRVVNVIKVGVAKPPTPSKPKPVVRPIVPPQCQSLEFGDLNTLSEEAYRALTLSLLPKWQQKVPQVEVLSQRENRAAGVQTSLSGSSMRTVVSKAVPIFPPLARAARVSGKVVVEVVIDETGRVTTARALFGPSLLVPAALNAAMAWQFSPLPRDLGSRLEITQITFHFE